MTVTCTRNVAHSITWVRRRRRRRIDSVLHVLSSSAPEVVRTKHEYTKLCDVWSMGVIMYTL